MTTTRTAAATLTAGVLPETLASLLSSRRNVGVTLPVQVAGQVRTVQLVRADSLRLADVLVENWDGELRLLQVSELALLGDDVEVNWGQLSTSQGNLVAVVVD